MRSRRAIILVVLFQASLCLAETEPSGGQLLEPSLYDHMRAMEQTQERLQKLSPEEQHNLQPQVRRAELQACQRLRQDQQDGVQQEEYRRQGGDAFVAYVQQFEQYCERLR